MSITALALVVMAALMHATWNLAAKRAAEGRETFLFLCSLLALPLYALPVAHALARDGLPEDARAWLVLAGSSGIHIVYSSVLQRAYREADLSLVYPVARGTGPLLTVLFAATLLGERPRPQAAIGIAIVIIGVFLLAGGARLFAARDARARAGLLWGALTGLLIAAYTVIDAYAIRGLALSPFVLDYSSHLLRVLVFSPVAYAQRASLRGELRRTFRYALVIALLGPLGYLFVLFALQHAPVSYVAPVRELSMLFAALLGTRLLAEGDAARRLASAALIAVGVALIAASR